MFDTVLAARSELFSPEVADANDPLYGWESVEFYKQWGGSWVTAANSKDPFLDPLNPQTPYSPALLNLFRFLLQSPDYAKRIQTHYEIFRQTVDDANSVTPYRTPHSRQRLRHSKTRL